MQFRRVCINSRESLDKLQEQELSFAARGCRKNAFENFIRSTVFQVTWVTRIAPRAVLSFNPRNVEAKKLIFYAYYNMLQQGFKGIECCHSSSIRSSSS